MAERISLETLVELFDHLERLIPAGEGRRHWIGPTTLSDPKTEEERTVLAVMVAQEDQDVPYVLDRTEDPIHPMRLANEIARYFGTEVD